MNDGVRLEKMMRVLAQNHLYVFLEDTEYPDQGWCIGYAAAGGEVGSGLGLDPTYESLESVLQAGVLHILGRREQVWEKLAKEKDHLDEEIEMLEELLAND